MSSCWLFYSTITCLLHTKFSLSSDTITNLDHIRLHLTLNPSSVIIVIKTFCLLRYFTVASVARTQYLKWKEVFIVQNTTCYSRKFDIMVRVFKMYESGSGKRSGRANMLIFYNFCCFY